MTTNPCPNCGKTIPGAHTCRTADSWYEEKARELCGCDGYEFVNVVGIDGERDTDVGPCSNCQRLAQALREAAARGAARELEEAANDIEGHYDSAMSNAPPVVLARLRARAAELREHQTPTKED